MKKILLLTAMFMAMNTWSADYQVTDTVSTDTASKVCAITLKGKKQTVESEIFKYSCVIAATMARGCAHSSRATCWG